MRFAKVLVAAAITLCISSMASAEITTDHIATDQDLIALLSDTLFVSEGRIGDRGGMATFELDLGGDTGDPATTAQYNWQSGVVEPFTVTYDSGTSEVTFSLGGITLYYTTPWFDFDQVFIRTRAVDEGTFVTVDNIVIEGESVGAQSHADGSGLDILWIKGASLNDGFTMTGDAVLFWSGTPPTHSRLAFQVKIGKLGIVSTEESTWSRIKRLHRSD
jgi:hypothetical protein